MGNTNKSCNCKLEGIGVSIQQTSEIHGVLISLH